MTGYSRAKAAADKAFSLYVRLRDAGDNGIVECCTCGKCLPWRESQCGHFVTRTHLSVRWDERNAHAQCGKCNKWEGGNQFRHGKLIDVLYGYGTADKIIEIGNKIIKRSAEDLREIAEDYTRQAEELAEAKGLEL